MLNIRCFKAGKGDCFLLTWNCDGRRRLLIDSGIEGTYRFIGPLVRDFGKGDHVIMTHVDYDHIGGILKWLNDRQEKFSHDISLYINTPQLLLTADSSDKVSIEHGVDLEELLRIQGIIPKSLLMSLESDNMIHLDGISVQILCPNEEIIKKLVEEWTANEVYQEYLSRRLEQDNKVSSQRNKSWRSKEDILKSPPKPHKWNEDLLNSSSIAFILDIRGSKLLFLGDANPEVIADELSRCKWSKDKKLPLKLLKVSHHGSKRNTTQRLLEMVDCSAYLISTDSSGPYYHPSRETLILISEYGREDNTVPITIYSNYKLDVDNLLTEEERINITFKEIHEINID